MARVPKCFRCLMLMLSGPVELFVLEFLMASLTWSVVMVMLVVFSRLTCLSVVLLCLRVVCLM